MHRPYITGALIRSIRFLCSRSRIQIHDRASVVARAGDSIFDEGLKLTFTSERDEARLEKRSRLLHHLTSDWIGDPIGDGLVRILNSSGCRPPLLWCFNASAEPPVMARGLGPDQPVVAMRSLHLVEPLDATRYGSDEEIAAVYTRILLDAAGLKLDGCIVGGNCQGAGVAAHIAAALVAAGQDVRALIVMESASPLPFPGRVGMIYGARSEMFNPFLRGEAPEGKWKSLFSDPVCEIIPGSHGEYFTDENSPALCRAIETIAAGAGPRASDRETDGLRLRLDDPPASLVAGQVASLPVGVSITRAVDGADLGRPFVLYHLWTSLEHGVSDRSGFQPLPVAPGEADGDLTLILPFAVPAEAGRWELRLFPCYREAGPLSWTEARARRWSIEVVSGASV